MVIERLGDQDKLLKKLGGRVFKTLIIHGNLQGNVKHVQCKHAHPRGTIGLFQAHARIQRRASVEYTDVIQPEETSFKHVVAVGILTVDPPGEIDQQFMKCAFQKIHIALAFHLLLGLVHFQYGPGLYGRIHIREVPLIRRKLPIGFHIPLPHDQQQLVLGKGRIRQRQRNTLKSQIPRGIPGELPFVRHRNDILVFQMLPIMVPAILLMWAMIRDAIALIDPSFHIVMIKLLAPEHAGKGLALDVS